nr:hypothetical protein [Tanacetum cinerariifolium]
LLGGCWEVVGKVVGVCESGGDGLESGRWGVNVLGGEIGSTLLQPNDGDMFLEVKHVPCFINNFWLGTLYSNMTLWELDIKLT